MTISDFRKLFRYEFWANRTVAEALGDHNPEAVELFGHILASQRLWLDRVTGAPQSMPVWPELTMDACIHLLEELEAEWREYLDGMSDEALERRFRYVNSKGQSWTSTVSDTLTHLITHAGYHRGQIALRMRQAGDAPAYTDFIHAARNNLL